MRYLPPLKAFAVFSHFVTFASVCDNSDPVQRFQICTVWPISSKFKDLSAPTGFSSAAVHPKLSTRAAATRVYYTSSAIVGVIAQLYMRNKRCKTQEPFANRQALWKFMVKTDGREWTATVARLSLNVTVPLQTRKKQVWLH